MTDIKRVVKRSEVESARKSLEIETLAKKNILEADPQSIEYHAAKKLLDATEPFNDEAREILQGVTDGTYQVEEDEKPESSEVVTVDAKPVASEAEVATAHAVSKIETFLAIRKAFITLVNEVMVKGKDYHVIQGRKSLAKGGAEKIASVFQWSASFVKDAKAIEMLGDMPGLVAFKCELHDPKGTYLGEGRGAALLAKNAGDPNKTLKMAQKSAYIDAVIRTSGLSDFFTQDIEDMNPADIGKPPVSAPQKKQASPAQKKLIQDLCRQKNIKKEEFEELLKKYNNPSDLIKYLIEKEHEAKK